MTYMYVYYVRKYCTSIIAIERTNMLRKRRHDEKKLKPHLKHCTITA